MAKASKPADEAKATLKDLQMSPAVAERMVGLPDDVDVLKQQLAGAQVEIEKSTKHSRELETQLQSMVAQAEKAENAEKKLETYIKNTDSRWVEVSDMHYSGFGVNSVTIAMILGRSGSSKGQILIRSIDVDNNQIIGEHILSEAMLITNADGTNRIQAHS